MTARRCPACGEIIDTSWRFCPSCGEEVHVDFFSELFDDFNRQIREIERERRMQVSQRRNFEVFDATPMFFQNAGGFSVKVTRKGNEKPQVQVKTFGNVRPQDVARGLAAQGISISGKVSEPENPEKKPLKKSVQKVSEPQTKVSSEGSRVIIEMSLPGVETVRDIEISKMESSVEVRAYGGDQGYFKIIAIPDEARLVGKSFSAGVLRLELEK